MKIGWEIRTLDDIADVKGGKRVPKGYQLQSEPTEHPYITVSDFTDDGTIDTSELRYISDKVFEQIKRYTISSKDLYLSIAGTIGKTGYVPVELDGANLTENACKLVLRNGTDRDFLYYFTKSADFAEQAGANTRTAAQPKLALERLKTIKLCVPPLPEQQRIVRILDEAFEDIATAKANTEKNLQNARALFESYLQSVFTRHGKGWVETTFGAAYDVRDGTHDSPKYHVAGYPLITSKNLKREGLSFDNVKLISQQDCKKINERSAVHKGDVLFAMIGTIGNPTLVDVEPKFAIKNVALFKIPNDQSGSFLKHYLDSGWVISKMTKEAKGTTQKFVGLGYLRAFPINLPPLATQLEIVEELDELAEETRRLASLYEGKFYALETLKKSLLHQAFSGNL
jgi:type I restriction enzyme S subunit